jgi:hypothetical protein
MAHAFGLLSSMASDKGSAVVTLSGLYDPSCPSIAECAALMVILAFRPYGLFSTEARDNEVAKNLVLN